MNILIAYATNSGGTYLVTQQVAQLLSSHQIIHLPIDQTSLSSFPSYDLVILASPSWDYQGQEGQPHIDFINFINQAGTQKLPNLQTIQFAIIGLGDRNYTHFCGAVDHLEKFVRTLGGHLLIDSLRINQFFFHQSTSLTLLADWTQALTQKLS